MKKIFVYGDPETLKNYAAAIKTCGAVPHITTDVSEHVQCGALLLAGGGDVAPEAYGQSNTDSKNIDEKRDTAEFDLVKHFVSTGRPIFGVCRGMQVLNIAMGGTLQQQVKHNQTHAYEEPTGDKVHLISGTQNGFLQKLYGDEFSVNSAHHQACITDAKTLAYTAFAPDGVAEALENPAKRIYAVQFHPERMAFAHQRADAVDGRLIWEFFINQMDV